MKKLVSLLNNKTNYNKTVNSHMFAFGAYITYRKLNSYIYIYIYSLNIVYTIYSSFIHLNK